MICKVCPHFCDLQQNETGKCGVRFNLNGLSILKYYGNISSISVDSIEKRPFFHFLPGSKTLAVGFYGCQLSCNFCFNYKVSQNIIDHKKHITPTELVENAIKNNCEIISFTFNEPTLYYEYIIDTAREASKFNIKIVVKSNGFLNSEILKILCESVHAFNIDIKGDEYEYARTCGASFLPVIETIKFLQSKTHLEISYLVLPRLRENFGFHSQIIDLICSLNKRLPVHLIYYYMFYKMNEPNYMPVSLIKIHEFFKKYLTNVYISNLYDKSYAKYRNTYCMECGEIMVDRSQAKTCIIKAECCKTFI